MRLIRLIRVIRATLLWAIFYCPKKDDGRATVGQASSLSAFVGILGHIDHDHEHVNEHEHVHEHEHVNDHDHVLTPEA